MKVITEGDILCDDNEGVVYLVMRNLCNGKLEARQMGVVRNPIIQTDLDSLTRYEPEVYEK